MAIVTSDLHCNWEKVEKFLAYKPEGEHVFAGDILDSYNCSLESAKKSLDLLIESDCILLWGNHDRVYLDRNKKPFNCSGHRWQDAPIFEAVLQPNKDRFNIAYVANDYLITHAGVADFLAIEDDIYKEAEYLNSCPEGTYHIGAIRGGYQSTGGPLWFDFRYEQGLSTKYNQVFGHCCLKQPERVRHEETHTEYVCINTYEDAPELWVFDTKLKEITNIAI